MHGRWVALQVVVLAVGGSCGDCTDGRAGALPATRLCLVAWEGAHRAERLLPGTGLTIGLTAGGRCVDPEEIVEEATCVLSRNGNDFSVTGHFIVLERTCSSPSNPICRNPGAECWTGTLPDGRYTVTSGALHLAFSVPSDLPGGEMCDGRAP